MRCYSLPTLIIVVLYGNPNVTKLSKLMQILSLCQLKFSKRQFQKYKGCANSKFQSLCQLKSYQLKVSKVQRSYQLKVSKVQRLCQLKVSKVPWLCQLKASIQKCKGCTNSRFQGQVFYTHYYLIVVLIFALRIK